MQRRKHLQEQLGAPDEAGEGKRANFFVISAAHVLFQRVMIRTGAAFESFKEWLRAAKLSETDVPGGSTGASRQLTAVMPARSEQDASASFRGEIAVRG